MEDYTVNMDMILAAEFGDWEGKADVTDKVIISYKKNVSVKPYETETTEGAFEVLVPRSLTGAERVVCLGILQAQVEYEVFCMLLLKEQISVHEFNTRKRQLEVVVNKLVHNSERVLGKSLRYLFKAHGD